MLNKWALWLFSENNSDMQISLFSFWHIFYLVLIFGGAILLACLLRKRSGKAKDVTLKIFAYLTIGIYIADFFIMPLSDSYSFGISAWKLPFNICTLVGVFVPFAQFNKKFKPIKGVVAMLAMASAVMWMVYPGTALGGEPPFSFVIFQTFMYHGFLFTWGFLTVTIGDVKLHIKHCWKDLLGILVVLVWAAFGNAVYDMYDWFFITGETFPIFPKWVMPFFVVALVFVVCLALYGITHLVRFIVCKIERKKSIKQQKQIVEEDKKSDQIEKGEV